MKTKRTLPPAGLSPHFYAGVRPLPPPQATAGTAPPLPFPPPPPPPTGPPPLIPAGDQRFKDGLTRGPQWDNRWAAPWGSQPGRLSPTFLLALPQSTTFFSVLSAVLSVDPSNRSSNFNLNFDSIQTRHLICTVFKASQLHKKIFGFLHSHDFVDK